MLFLPKALFLISLVLLLTTSNVFAFHKDYSKRGEEFGILKGIRLDVGKINYLEKRQVEVEGQDFEASVFQVNTTVTAQTKESVVSQGSVFEELDAEYELIVGEDKGGIIHDKLIADINKFWSTHPRDNSVTYDKNVSWKNDSYLIFVGDGRDLVWLNGKFIRLIFKDYIHTKKWGLGAEQEFMEKKIRFYVNDKRIGLRYLENGLQDEFLRLYKEGRFTK